MVGCRGVGVSGVGVDIYILYPIYRFMEGGCDGFLKLIHLFSGGEGPQPIEPSTHTQPKMSRTVAPRSHSVQSKSSLNRTQQVKPFCKVCFDSGKPESLYNSHFVRVSRDPTSRVTCPTLLNTECRYCSAVGHTVSKCPKLGRSGGGETVYCRPVVAKPVPSTPTSVWSEEDDVDADTDTDDTATMSTVSDTHSVVTEVSHTSKNYLCQVLLRKLKYQRGGSSWADADDSDDE